jgi:hypothetical protein
MTSLALDDVFTEPSRPTKARSTVARAYVEVLGVFLMFFGASVLFAVSDLAGRLTEPIRDPSWAVLTPQAVDDLAHAALAVAVVILLGRTSGITRADLGLAWRRDEHGRVARWSEIRLGALAFIALIVGSVVAAIVKTHGPHLGFASTARFAYETAHSIEAGIMEECVVLAFLVTRLRRINRPVAEIVAVGLILRMSYHVYYGTGAIGMGVWGALFILLYWRTNSLLPLIAAHVWWDFVLTLSHHWNTAGGIAILCTLAFVVAAGISALVTSVRRSNGVPWSASAPIGWYLDPESSEWRWWDGTAWVVRTDAPV